MPWLHGLTDGLPESCSCQVQINNTEELLSRLSQCDAQFHIL